MGSELIGPWNSDPGIQALLDQISHLEPLVESARQACLQMENKLTNERRKLYSLRRLAAVNYCISHKDWMLSDQSIPVYYTKTTFTTLRDMNGYIHVETYNLEDGYVTKIYKKDRNQRSPYSRLPEADLAFVRSLIENKLIPTRKELIAKKAND